VAFSANHFARLAAFAAPGWDAYADLPHLIWEAPPGVPSGVSQWSRTDGGQSQRPRAGEPLILPLKKAPGPNPFVMGITLGRGDTNDLVIDDESVSRFHAFFQFDARQKCWTLSDADSSNGTFVNGKPLQPQKKFILEFPSSIQFGSTKIKFCSHAFLLASVAHLIERFKNPR
jgi:hypothetical protein